MSDESLKEWFELRMAVQEAMKMERGALVRIAEFAELKYKRVHENITTGTEPSYSRGMAIKRGLLAFMAARGAGK